MQGRVFLAWPFVKPLQRTQGLRDSGTRDAPINLPRSDGKP